jgi:hypothetical protein
MKRLLLATVVVCSATSAMARDENAMVDCLIGQATVSLHKQTRGEPIDAKRAVDVAMRAPDKCPKGRLSEGESTTRSVT